MSNIRDHLIKDEGLHFRTEWEGYSDITTEPGENFIIGGYLNEHVIRYVITHKFKITDPDWIKAAKATVAFLDSRKVANFCIVAGNWLQYFTDDTKFVSEDVANML